MEESRGVVPGGAALVVAGSEVGAAVVVGVASLVVETSVPFCRLRCRARFWERPGRTGVSCSRASWPFKAWPRKREGLSWSRMFLRSWIFLF